MCLGDINVDVKLSVNFWTEWLVCPRVLRQTFPGIFRDPFTVIVTDLKTNMCFICVFCLRYYCGCQVPFPLWMVLRGQSHPRGSVTPSCEDPREAQTHLHLPQLCILLVYIYFVRPSFLAIYDLLLTVVCRPSFLTIPPIVDSQSYLFVSPLFYLSTSPIDSRNSDPWSHSV